MAKKTPWGDVVSRGRSMGGDKRESGLPAGGAKNSSANRTFEMKPGMNKGVAPIGPNKKGAEYRMKALKKKMGSM